MKHYKPKEFAEMLHVSVKTLQRWDNEGVLKAYRNPKGRRYYTEEQYREYMGIPKENQVGKTVIYARVSNKGRKDDLENQVEFLRQYANAKGMIVDEVVTDIGSGLNYKRKHWNRLIEACVDGKVSTILIAHKDRFVRFGYEWFEQFLDQLGVKIIVINNEKLSPQEELVQDLMSIIHVFSCRVYGLKKYKDKMKEDQL
ncbi:IS607 family transposase [Anoxybacillus flavithermus]|uniref:Predicted site-specific integrase/resolvase (IS transposase ) n=1 Tax=Anoxybacillus flavithermus (strain DSM 21510 / WK1) TaxID=491915 RepID=B7GM65_ANOFW|nr:Predicted site-specific integrase/resolvase (IS transposase) [Anoxybacillus flavithermus WK1]